MEILAEGLARLCALPQTRLDEIIFGMNRYMDELERFNPAYGLVKVSGREELVIKHILDSIAPLDRIIRLIAPAVCNGPPRLADAGSGAGLPGIPLALCLPDTAISLVERSARRAGFLRNTAAVLGLANLTVEETEIEKAAPGRFDIVVFRALSPLTNETVKNLARLVRTDGILAAYKGKHIKAEQELACSGIRGEIIPLQVPFLDEERCLVVIDASFAMRKIISAGNTAERHGA